MSRNLDEATEYFGDDPDFAQANGIKIRKPRKGKTKKPGTKANKAPRSLDPTKQAKARAKKMVDPIPKKSKAKKVVKEAKAPKAKKAPKPAATIARAEKTDGPGFEILKLIKRPQGATITDLMAATGWQAHSVRGYLSTQTKKRGQPIMSEQVRVDATGRLADSGRVKTIYKWGGK